jgi:hypothetical protein
MEKRNKNRSHTSIEKEIRDMTLEEVDTKFTLEHRTAINTVGKNELVLKKRLPDTSEKPYALFYALEPQQPIAFNGSLLGEYFSLLGEYFSLGEVQSHLISLSFAPDIDPNGWVISPEKG